MSRPPFRPSNLGPNTSTPSSKSWPMTPASANPLYLGPPNFMRNSISARSDCSSDKASFVTQGGTRQIISLNAITKNTTSLITFLESYIASVHAESNPSTQWPRFITSGLTLAEYAVKSLQRHNNQLALQNADACVLVALVDIVRGIRFDECPTFVSLFKANPDQHRDLENYTGIRDIPAMHLEQARTSQQEIVKAWELGIKCGRDDISPARFGKNRGWHEMQTRRNALLCHRPASNRPHRPLEIMHRAFYEFFNKVELDNGELAGFHAAAQALCKHATDSLGKEIDRANLILEALKKVFPDIAPFKWYTSKEYLVYQRVLSGDYDQRFVNQKRPHVTNLIIVKVKLEEGENGDAFMHLSRYYGNIVESNPRYCETGAPMFLITISGPSIKFCGGWADNPGYGASIDVFETHFACLDVADRHRWELAKSIYSLSRAIKCLPSCHIPSSGRIIKDLPSIFTSFKLCNPQQAVIYGLHLLTPLPSDLCCSVFGAFIYPCGTNPKLSNRRINCVAKLVYRHYGVAAHQVLQEKSPSPGLETFAPELFGWSENPGIDARVYVMEYLFPPNLDSEGWLTLTALGLNKAAAKLDFIFQVLEGIVDCLMEHKLVHGDLRPNNLMVKMTHSDEIAQPVQIKVVDFEWGGEIGSARYPYNRNEDVGYPGEPGGLIGLRDDFIMIDNWRKSMQDYKNHHSTDRNGGDSNMVLTL